MVTVSAEIFGMLLFDLVIDYQYLLRCKACEKAKAYADHELEILVANAALASNTRQSTIETTPLQHCKCDKACAIYPKCALMICRQKRIGNG